MSNQESALAIVDQVVTMGKHSISTNCFSAMLRISGVRCVVKRSRKAKFMYKGKCYKVITHGNDDYITLQPITELELGFH